MARSSEREDREERGFRYNRRSSSDVQQRANAKGGNFDSIIKAKYKVYKIRDGKNLIRILPPTWDEARHYGYDIWVNYSVGVDNQSYLSLSKMKGEKDPLAEARREAERDGDKKLSKELQPRQRILMWVIDRNEEDEGPQLLAAPFTVDKALAALSFDEDTKEVIYLDDPKEGCDVRFYREGTGLKTDYPAEKMRILKPSPLHPDKGQAKEWLEYIADNPVPECLQYYSYEHISNTFDGGSAAADDDDDKPKSRARGNGRDDDEDQAPRKRSRPADDDDSDDGDAKPTGRSRAAADEDDEPPKRTRERVVDDDEDDPPFEKTKTSRSQRGRSEDDEDSPTEPSNRRSRATDDDDDADQTPRRARGRLQPEEQPEDEAPRRRARAADDDEDADVKPRGSIRDRLSRRRPADDDED